MMLDEKDLNITIISKPGLSVASISFKRDNFEIAGYDMYSKKKVDIDSLVDIIQNGTCVLVRVDDILSNFDMFNFWLKVADLLLKKGVAADKILICSELHVINKNIPDRIYSDMLIDRLILTNHFKTDSMEIRLYTLGVLTYIKWCGAYSLDYAHTMNLEMVKHYVFANSDCLLRQINESYGEAVEQSKQNEFFDNEVRALKMLKSAFKCGGCTDDIINFNSTVITALKILALDINSSAEGVVDDYTSKVANTMFGLLNNIESLEEAIPTVKMFPSMLNTGKKVLIPILNFNTKFMYSDVPYCKKIVAIRTMDIFKNYNAGEYNFDHLIKELYAMYNEGCYVKELSWVSSSFITLDEECNIDKSISLTFVGDIELRKFQ